MIVGSLYVLLLLQYTEEEKHDNGFNVLRHGPVVVALLTCFVDDDINSLAGKINARWRGTSSRNFFMVKVRPESPWTQTGITCQFLFTLHESFFIFYISSVR